MPTLIALGLPKVNRSIQESARKDDNHTMAAHFAQEETQNRRPTNCRRPTISLSIPLPHARVRTIHIICEQVRRILQTDKLKPDKNGEPKAPPQLRVSWIWKVHPKFGPTFRKRLEEVAPVNAEAVAMAKQVMPVGMTDHLPMSQKYFCVEQHVGCHMSTWK